LLLVGSVMASGCSQSGPSQSGPGQATVTTKPQPAGTFQAATDVLQQQKPLDPATAKAIGAAADTFMRAILSGDTARAASLLTAKAAQRIQNDPTLLTPMGMQVESLALGEIRLLSDAEAAAQCLVNELGVTEPQELCCLLKFETGGWRVCGLACDAGGGTPAVISFEEDLQAASTPQFVDGANPSAGDAPRTAQSPTTGEVR
jgi:hypothetical protein